ncbi:DoxX family protein [Luteibacter pinisoli]|uniref:DoxX family protein n=1 Tax=Luteibacter pinisoli TaxID=2589080 RepID=A0A4Y5Z805_9GAMM|nr:DoxX family protein [Luteibacter pinisoli]
MNRPAPLRVDVVLWLALLALCSAYLQGAICKLIDFNAAIGEMQHFGLSPAHLFAAGVIAFELVCALAVLTGHFRWIGAFALALFTFAANFLANAWWHEAAGPGRDMMMNGFFEHLGLAGAFVYVGWLDLRGTRHGH